MRMVLCAMLLLTALVVVGAPGASACEIQQTTPVSETCADEYGYSNGDPTCTDEGSSSGGTTFFWTEVDGVVRVDAYGSGFCNGGPGTNNNQWFWLGVWAPGIGGATAFYNSQTYPFGGGFCNAGAGVWLDDGPTAGVGNLPCVYGPYPGWGHLIP